MKLRALKTVPDMIAPFVVLCALTCPTDCTGLLTPVFERAWGQFGGAPGQFNVPRGVCVAHDGTVYVADVVNCRVQVFTTEGALLRQWGSYGDAPGLFKAPHGLALDHEERILVSDIATCRIQKFTPDGQVIVSFGERGTAPGQFGGASTTIVSGPMGIAVAPDGSLYVADPGNDRVQHFTSEGVFISTFTTVSDAGTLGEPRGVSIDRDGDIVVCDPQAERVARYSPDGALKAMWGCCGAYVDVHEDPDGLAWALDTDSGLFQVYHTVGTYAGNWGASGANLGQFLRPEGFAFGPHGTLYVADTGSNRIQKFTGAVAVAPTTWGGIKQLFRSER